MGRGAGGRAYYNQNLESQRFYKQIFDIVYQNMNAQRRQKNLINFEEGHFNLD